MSKLKATISVQQPLLPGYLIESDWLSQPIVFIANHKLITARREAMTRLEAMLEEIWRRDDYTTNIQIHLVEANPMNPLATAKRIALVYQRDTLDLGPWSETKKAHFLDELTALDEEFNYYLQNQQSMGQGFFHIHSYQEGRIDPVAEQCVIADAFGYAMILTGGFETAPGEPDSYSITPFHSMRPLHPSTSTH